MASLQIPFDKFVSLFKWKTLDRNMIYKFYPLVDFVQKAQMYQIPAKGIPYKPKFWYVIFHTNTIRPVVWPPKDLIPPFHTLLMVSAWLKPQIYTDVY